MSTPIYDELADEQRDVLAEAEPAPDLSASIAEAFAEVTTATEPGE